MKAHPDPEIRQRLECIVNQLELIQSGAEQHLGALALRFEDLAQRVASILDIAGRIAGSVAAEQMHSVAAGIRSVGSSADASMRQRITAAADMLQALALESACLLRLVRVTRSQKAIVRETEMLRVLTRIEVGRLGADGLGFQYLADELDDFSQTLHGTVGELIAHTAERRTDMEAARRSLTGQLPKIREEFASLQSALGNAISRVGAAINELSDVPARYQGCVSEIATLIAGVVAAIQTHDVTRQQIDHVRESLAGFAGMYRAADPAGLPCGPELLHTVIRVQVYQLRSAGRTVAAWIAQIRSCLEAMTQVSAGQIASLGSVVLCRERELAGHTSEIERFERDCRAGQSEVQESLRGIQSLMLLVREHLEKSKTVRDRLQLLMFNSIIEASRLGARADGIREISMSIRRVSSRWNAIAGESEQTLEAMLELADRSQQAFQSFTGEGNRGSLTTPEVEGAMEALRCAAACAESEGRRIEEAVVPLQAMIAETGAETDRLESCFAPLTQAIDALGAAMLPADASLGSRATRGEEMEAALSRLYTTEAERTVLRAALTGAALPDIRQSDYGNAVELF